MNVLTNRMSVFAMLAGLLGASSSQAAVQAQFHLPVAAHWGSTLLAPGNYTIEVKGFEPGGSKQVGVQGAGPAAWRMPVATDTEAISNSSSLQLVEVDGEYFVREYRAGSVGKTFTFGLPKHGAGHSRKPIEMASK